MCRSKKRVCLDERFMCWFVRPHCDPSWHWWYITILILMTRYVRTLFDALNIIMLFMMYDALLQIIDSRHLMIYKHICWWSEWMQINTLKFPILSNRIRWIIELWKMDAFNYMEILMRILYLYEHMFLELLMCAMSVQKI